MKRHAGKESSFHLVPDLDDSTSSRSYQPSTWQDHDSLHMSPIIHAECKLASIPPVPNQHLVVVTSVLHEVRLVNKDSSSSHIVNHPEA